MPQFEHAPIQRHESLAPFSRDHYGGLVQARHLIKAAGDDEVTRRKVLSEFVDAWDREIAEHVRDEQRLLLDVMSAEDRDRLLREHRQLTNLAARARELRRQTDPDAETLKRIGEALERHIRWEDRELFGRLQDQLDDEQLAVIGHHTAEIEASRPRNACRDSGENRTSP